MITTIIHLDNLNDMDPNYPTYGVNETTHFKTQSSSNPMEVFFDIHLNLIKTT